MFQGLFWAISKWGCNPTASFFGRLRNLSQRADRGEEDPEECEDSSNDSDSNSFPEAKDFAEYSSGKSTYWYCAPHNPPHSRVHPSLNVSWHNRLSQAHLVDVVDDDSNRRDKASHHQHACVKVEPESAEQGNPGC